MVIHGGIWLFLSGGVLVTFMFYFIRLTELLNFQVKVKVFGSPRLRCPMSEHLSFSLGISKCLNFMTLSVSGSQVLENVEMYAKVSKCTQM